MTPRTMVEKIWDAHVVHRGDGEPDLLYVDMHLVHEVTSPQAFEGLRMHHRRVRRPDLTFAVLDHNVPTWPRTQPITDPISKKQIEALERNAPEFGVRLEGLLSQRQGIVHIIGPELGLTLPGMLIVCGDSHTATHGALGALAFGIGTSEVEHVLATQMLPQRRPKTMEIRVDGALPPGTTPKDLILGIIRKIGVGGGMGHVVEYTGSTIRALSMEGRMTVCNMTIEGGARAGLIAPDDTTLAYSEGRPYAPRGAAWARAVEYWRGLPTDPGAAYDARVEVDAEDDRAVRDVGHESVAVRAGDRPRARSGRAGRSAGARRGRAGARVHGPAAGHADSGDRGRPGVHRVVHQRADRGPAGGRARRGRAGR